ncbi:hypothetical protein OG320_29885 [Microbispora sp. NBC_01189]|uniref:hypothetical protein n=1 Tax=Microbispora sp. NBC_01189 TaxID=2903583 RepID=UPI002E0F0075|nr:hypothetical protein OG320_29885 [Microbispora sp. NBC_01189]
MRLRATRSRPLRFRSVQAGLCLALATALATAAACGDAPDGASDGDGIAAASTARTTAEATPSASASTDLREAQLKFAQCMREHGVDMPDPDADGRVRITGRKGQEATTREAMRACEHFMKNAVGDRAGAGDPRERDRMLKFAQCMREHGVDMPDPKPGEGLLVKVKPGQEKTLETAHKACEEFAPGERP